MGVVVIRGSRSGMFSNVNAVIGAALYAESVDCGLRVNWKRNRYGRTPNENAWRNFFTHWDDGAAVERGDKRYPNFLNMRNQTITPEGPIVPAPRKRARRGRVLLPPCHRDRVHAIISKYFRLQPCVQDAIEQKREMLGGAGHVLGVHLRGPGGLHNGVHYLSSVLGQGCPPYPAFFNAIDARLTDRSVIHLCTDAGCVIEAVRERYGDRVIVTTSHANPKGETHLDKRNAGEYKPSLGIDVLSDIWLLCESDVFIHGNSNITNFVLCKALGIENVDVYQACYPVEDVV